MTKLKFTVKCVNEGKPFDMPAWTVDKHNSALAKLAKDQKENKWDEQKAADEFKYYIIHETMLELDPNCKIEDLRHFLRHPQTLIELFNAVYNAGKENIFYIENFRKGRKTPKDKN